MARVTNKKHRQSPKQKTNKRARGGVTRHTREQQGLGVAPSCQPRKAASPPRPSPDFLVLYEQAFISENGLRKLLEAVLAVETFQKQIFIWAKKFRIWDEDDVRQELRRVVYETVSQKRFWWVPAKGPYLKLVQAKFTQYLSNRLTHEYAAKRFNPRIQEVPLEFCGGDTKSASVDPLKIVAFDEALSIVTDSCGKFAGKVISMLCAGYRMKELTELLEASPGKVRMARNNAKKVLKEVYFFG